MSTNRQFATNPFRFTSLQLALIFAETYLRMFWWMLIGVPLFGLVALLFASGSMQIFGYFCLAWLFVLPARSRFMTYRLSKLLTGDVLFWIEDGYLIWQTQASGMKLKVGSVRSVMSVQSHLVFLTHRFKVLVPVPMASFIGQDDATQLRNWSDTRPHLMSE